MFFDNITSTMFKEKKNEIIETTTKQIHISKFCSSGINYVKSLENKRKKATYFTGFFTYYVKLLVVSMKIKKKYFFSKYLYA